VLELYRQKAADLADLGVNLIHIGGAPPMRFMDFPEKIKSSRSSKRSIKCRSVPRGSPNGCDARARYQEIRRRHYFKDNMNESHPLFYGAGFEVAAMEGIDVAFKDVGGYREKRSMPTRESFLKASRCSGDLHAGLRLATPQDRAPVGTRPAGAGHLCACVQAVGCPKKVPCA